MRVTVDTSVLIAAFISRGVCHDLLEHLIRHHELAVSEHILNEFLQVLTAKFQVPPRSADAAAQLVRAQALLEPDVLLGERVSRDADDDAVFAVAVNSESACLVTGDDDLLSLESYKGVAILNPRDFWSFEAENRRA